MIVALCRLLMLLPLAAATPAAVVEAESTTDARVVEDANASGGKAASSDKAWQPLMACPVPIADLEVTVWIRHRRGPLCVKSLDGDTQRELGWVWNGVDEWVWSRVGRWQRSELGQGLLIIRDGGTGDGPLLDCVAFGDDRAPADPEPAAAIAVGIEWDTVVGTVPAMAYGINVFHPDPAVLEHVDYRRNLAYLAPGMVRIHNGGLLADAATSSGGWVDHATRSWAAVKVVRAVTALVAPDRELLINIPNFPAWMDGDQDGYLDQGRVDDFAGFCAALVRIVNVEAKLAVRWWEPTNELDGRYWIDLERDGKPSRHGELAEIHAACYRAMKAVDPTILVGGPAATRPDLRDQLRRYLAQCIDQHDFVSYHAYASGDAGDTDRMIFDRAVGMGNAVGSIGELMIELSPARHIPHLLDEVNISWSWETRDPRMASNKGAVFDALVLTSCAPRALAGLMAWNDRDGIYGKMDNAFALRPAAHVFHVLNQHGVGQVVAAASADAAVAHIFAVRSARGGRFAMVINRSNASCRIALSGWDGGAEVGGVDEDGVREAQPMASEAVRDLHLRRHSVTWLTGP